MDALELTLAGLIHDVGIVGARGFQTLEGVDAETRGWACQLTGADHPDAATSPDVLYTLQFLRQMEYLPPGLDRDRLARVIVGLVDPQSAEARLLAQAERLAGKSESFGRTSTGFPKPTHLVAIASRIGFSAQTPPTPGLIPLDELAPAKAFPLGNGDLAAEESSTAEAYRQLWHKLCRAWQENRCSDPAGFLSRALAILERFTWCVPAFDTPGCDIALVDHLRSVAAVAACLASLPEPTDQPFVLVAAELAGIQKYLFDLRQGTGGLARRLRARSFKVAAYLESVAIALLRRLRLSTAQRLLYAGGKVVLLLPHCPEVLAAIGELRSTVARWIFDQSQGEVTLTLATLPVRADEFANFTTVYSRLSQELRAARQRAGEDVLTCQDGWAEDAFLLPPIELAETEVRCESCRRRKAFVDEEGMAVCPHCRHEAELGRQLPAARYIVYYENGRGSEPAPVGSFRLVDDVTPENDGVALVVDLEGQGVGPATLPISAAFRSRFVPREKASGRVYEFAELASRSRGRPLLAVLKVDADNLGYIFGEGLRRSTAAEPGKGAEANSAGSLARVTALSRTLEVFFAGYVEELLRVSYPDVYLVYSGGDDLVAIGPWSVIFDLAGELREAFRRFTGGSPAWSFSAGIAVINPHVPVLVAVAEAEEALEISKRAPGAEVLACPPSPRWTGQPHKDRITAFDTSIPWKDYPALLEQSKQLARWIENKVVSTSQVRRLLWYAQLARKYAEEGDTQYLQYVPYLARDLRRTWGGATAEHQQAKLWASQFLLPGNREMIKAWFVCCYALYATRSSE